MKSDYICKVPSLQEMNTKWDYEISHSGEDKSNWIIWKKENISRFKSGDIIPYYGILNGTIICEATAIISPRAATVWWGIPPPTCPLSERYPNIREKGIFQCCLSIWKTI